MRCEDQAGAYLYWLLIRHRQLPNQTEAASVGINDVCSYGSLDKRYMLLCAQQTAYVEEQGSFFLYMNLVEETVCLVYLALWWKRLYALFILLSLARLVSARNKLEKKKMQVNYFEEKKWRLPTSSVKIHGEQNDRKDKLSVE